MTVIVLHLSDIHIKTAKDPILQRGCGIAATVFSSLPSACHVFIVVSGDIAFSGVKEEYECAIGLFTEIKSTIQKETSCPVSFIFVPGNHDCDFNKNNGVRRMAVESMEKQETPEVDNSIIDVCTNIQSDFFDFRDRLEGCSDISDDKLWRTSRFEVQEKVLEFDCLNISWVSKLKEEVGRLYFPVDRYSEDKCKQADVRIVVLHHPLNWFSQNSYRPFRIFVRKIANIVISGHEHQGNVGLITEAETGSSAFVEGCVLQGNQKNLTDSSFNVVELDLEQEQFSSTQYNWNGKHYAANEEGSWTDYHNLPAKRANQLAIEADFEELLDDPGAFFKHPSGTKVSLSDIYVYPDLRKMGKNERDRREFVSSSTLLSPAVTADGVLIEGDEKTGCTSLLYQIYRRYHDRNFFPLLIKGKDIKKSSDSEIDKLIRRAVETQYGKEQVEAFVQLGHAQKLLLLDDFDDSPFKTGDAPNRVIVKCCVWQLNQAAIL